MNRMPFLLSSDQLELLIAFEKSEGLNKLAEMMGRDPSVISRSLQKMAEEYPVLIKVKGRWELTPLGRQVNELSTQFILDQNKLLHLKKNKIENAHYKINEQTVLVVINAQMGLLDSTQEGRNNSQAEKNIAKILEYWRKNKMPIIHVRHSSENAESFFYKKSDGYDFLPECTPLEGEEIIDKTHSSAFTNTILESTLKKIGATQILLVGFTANECIDATAKDAATLNFSTLVAGDATSMFDMRNHEGKLIKAERLHKLTLANINAYWGKVISSVDILKN